ncbi:response regulator transcription factor [Phenylobacterium sp. J367]|uniref:response regulator transcription factor n=1 Tax=Phenylobacterium sp. J367 TaxID=2898435 RepID=UPI002151F4CF|nr:response regulator transcription factor [Phenylobacterium sp. J367]MCR5878709.1 response regulator transcription factor [Phenylobacterium sp. J367]
MKSFDLSRAPQPVRELAPDSLVAWRLAPSSARGVEGRVLLVGAQPDDAGRVASLLREHRFEVELAADVAAAEVMLATDEPDLVVLDPDMPGEDGLGLCRRLALRGAPPILLLTGRCEALDRVIGLELGADDVLGKDCHPLELVARARAAVRRRAVRPRTVTRDAEPKGRAWQGFRLDPIRRRLTGPDGRLLRLPAGETRLLGVFFAHPDRVLSRAELMDLAWRGEVAGRTVDVMACRLRRKLEAFSGRRLLVSVRGVGYALAPVA